jgi:hypothetical protein
MAKVREISVKKHVNSKEEEARIWQQIQDKMCRVGDGLTRNKGMTTYSTSEFKTISDMSEQSLERKSRHRRNPSITL